MSKNNTPEKGKEAIEVVLEEQNLPGTLSTVVPSVTNALTTVDKSKSLP